MSLKNKPSEQAIRVMETCKIRNDAGTYDYMFCLFIKVRKKT